jgi:hypothetical protein
MTNLHLDMLVGNDQPTYLDVSETLPGAESFSSGSATRTLSHFTGPKAEYRVRRARHWYLSWVR